MHEYSYDLSDVGCIEYVKITDTTSGKRIDGFDLDAVGDTKSCTDLTWFFFLYFIMLNSKKIFQILS